MRDLWKVGLLACLALGPAVPGFEVPGPRRGVQGLSLATGDGLRLTFDAGGEIASVQVGGEEVASAPDGGLLVREFRAGNPNVVRNPSLEESQGALPPGRWSPTGRGRGMAGAGLALEPLPGYHRLGAPGDLLPGPPAHRPSLHLRQHLTRPGHGVV